jgi:hypothetical protein
MQRAQIRRYALVILVILAAASMFPSFGGSDPAQPHRANPQPHRPQAPAAKARPQIRAAFRINK